MWSSLIPVILGSALVPIQVIITIALLRTPAGPRTAAAWVGGMTAVRLIQGMLFGLVFSSSDTTETSSSSSGSVVSVLLLVVAVLFFVTALKQFLHEDDPDGPPPKWMTMVASMTPAKAFAFGFGMLAIGAKFWVFTLSAIGVISDANLSRTSSILTFIAFVILAESIHLAVVGAAVVAPTRSTKILERAFEWLQRHNRVLVIILGVVFGTWFLVKALDRSGVSRMLHADRVRSDSQQLETERASALSPGRRSGVHGTGTCWSWSGFRARMCPGRRTPRRVASTRTCQNLTVPS